MQKTIISLMLALLCVGHSALLMAQTTFTTCIENIKQKALQSAISPKTVDTILNQVQHLPQVITFDRKQPEFSQTFYDYYRQRVTENRVNQGQQLLNTHRKLLNQLARQYGVPPHYLIAFWGMETNFGQYLGKMNTLDSLATLACDQRRSAFFTAELLDALRLIDNGTVNPNDMQGSWAGAMGNMQFMPSTYRQYGLDADGDGKINMWRSLPDAFTSAAFYLNQLGWEKGWRWGREVLLPKGFDYSLAGRGNPQPLKYWASLGILNTNHQPLPKLSKMAALIVPAGYQGPAFLVYENFNIILKWNFSEFYALSVGILANRINGEDGLKIQPPKATSFTVLEIQNIQKKLKALGFDVGTVDGIFGTNTKEALRQFQKQNGLIADGFIHDTVIQKLEHLTLK